VRTPPPVRASTFHRPTSMTSIPFRSPAALVVVASMLAVPATYAQGSDSSPATATAPACSYAACALTIAPRWNGLAVVQGMDGRSVTTLSFFWPRDMGGALGGPASPSDLRAREDATGALRLRRVGAALTDGGLVLLATAAVRAVSAGHVRQSDAVIAGIGAGAFGVSVPFQFAADGMLSRAVWWHNARFAR
jgi:hypothetical protein